MIIRRHTTLLSGIFAQVETRFIASLHPSVMNSVIGKMLRLQEKWRRDSSRLYLTVLIGGTIAEIIKQDMGLKL